MVKYKTEVVSSYDPYITLKKILYEALIVGLIAVGTYFVGTGFPALMLEYPQYAAIIVAISAIVAGLINWYNHRNDTKTIKVDESGNEIE